jgi:hypothetical protein
MTPMSQLQENFLDAVNRKCLHSEESKTQLFFKLRFTPEFHSKKGTDKRIHKEIAKLVNEQLKEDGTIYENNEFKVICKALVNTFEAQMIEDGVNVGFLKSNKPGTNYKWLIVYDWLWEKNFPHWLLDQRWQELVDQADKVDNWLQVKPTQRNIKIPENSPENIPLNTNIYLLINWKGESRYFLLLNQGTAGNKYCLCPSKGFAPSGELSQQEMYLPQMGAMTKSIIFEEAGKEHFLGIVMEKPIDLAWLRPNGQEPVPALDAGRLNELLEKLEQQGNWQIFYKSFEVV